MRNYDEVYKENLKIYLSRLIRLSVFGGIIILTLIILYLINKDNSKIDETHTISLSGIIEKKFVYQGYTWITIKGYSKRYVLDYARNYKLDPSFLDEYLLIGDSINKPPNSDSLYIYRNDKVCFFILGNLVLNRSNFPFYN